MNRSMWDKIVSGAGAVVAVVLIVLGSMAIYGGVFARNNVRDRLEPQHIDFPPAEAMTPEEQAEVGEFAGQQVDTGTEAEAYSRYIAGHLAAVNDGKTYSETSSEAGRWTRTTRRAKSWTRWCRPSSAERPCGRSC